MFPSECMCKCIPYVLNDFYYLYLPLNYYLLYPLVFFLTSLCQPNYPYNNLNNWFCLFFAFHQFTYSSFRLFNYHQQLKSIYRFNEIRFTLAHQPICSAQKIYTILWTVIRYFDMIFQSSDLIHTYTHRALHSVCMYIHVAVSKMQK